MDKNFLSISDEERKEYLKRYFMYEVRMLFFALRKNIELKQYPLQYKEDPVNYQNIFLEDFLLHAKVLLEFFYDLEKKKTSQYIEAWHFYESLEDYKKILPQKTSSIKLVEKRINPELSHLGINRMFVVPDQKGWNVVKILHDFMDLVKIFIDNLPEKYYSEELRKY